MQLQNWTVLFTDAVYFAYCFQCRQTQPASINHQKQRKTPLLRLQKFSTVKVIHSVWGKEFSHHIILQMEETGL